MVSIGLYSPSLLVLRHWLRIQFRNSNFIVTVSAKKKVPILSPVLRQQRHQKSASSVTFLPRPVHHREKCCTTPARIRISMSTDGESTDLSMESLSSQHRLSSPTPSLSDRSGAGDIRAPASTAGSHSSLELDISSSDFQNTTPSPFSSPIRIPGRLRDFVDGPSSPLSAPSSPPLQRRRLGTELREIYEGIHGSPAPSDLPDEAGISPSSSQFTDPLPESSDEDDNNARRSPAVGAGARVILDEDDDDAVPLVERYAVALFTHESLYVARIDQRRWVLEDFDETGHVSAGILM